MSVISAGPVSVAEAETKTASGLKRTREFSGCCQGVSGPASWGSLGGGGGEAQAPGSFSLSLRLGPRGLTSTCPFEPASSGPTSFSWHNLETGTRYPDQWPPTSTSGKGD